MDILLYYIAGCYAFFFILVFILLSIRYLTVGNKYDFNLIVFYSLAGPITLFVMFYLRLNKQHFVYSEEIEVDKW